LQARKQLLKLGNSLSNSYTLQFMNMTNNKC
jgi:hypothetical protein